MTWQELAKQQHGIVSVGQSLRAHGLTRHAIARLRAGGDVVETGSRGVLQAAAARPTLMSASWAAVLASGGVLSYSTAARLWRIEVPATAHVHVTVPRARRIAAPAGTWLHRINADPRSVRRLNGLPVTDRAQSVLDCLGVMRRTEAMDLFDRALQQGWVDLAAVARRLDDEPRRPGNTALRWLLGEVSMGEARSERLLHAILRDAGIVGWRANFRIGSYEGDVVFESHRVVVEIDGLAFHVTPDRFQSDRLRQNALVTAGWVVLRFTWRDLDSRPRYVADTIGRALKRVER